MGFRLWHVRDGQLGEGVAHLNYLQGRGRLASSVGADGARRFATARAEETE